MKKKKGLVLIIIIGILLISIGVGIFIILSKEMESIILKVDKVELRIGDTYDLDAYYVNKQGKKEQVIYSSSNPEIISINQKTGHITVKGTGTAEIIIMSATDNTIYKTCRVIVTEKEEPETKDNVIHVTGITLNKTSTTINIGTTEQLTYMISPQNANNKDVTWKSSNTDIVTVNQSGTITAIKEGMATITATTTDQGKTEKIAVTVVIPTTPVTGITLSKEKTSINVGSSQKITASIHPNNATNKDITWNSSNTNIASVDENGVVIGKK